MKRGKQRFSVIMKLQEKIGSKARLSTEEPLNVGIWVFLLIILSNKQTVLMLIRSQVIYVAGIRHLLHVHPERPVVARVKLDNAVLDHVLQVGKASPDVPLVLHGVRSWAGVPVPEAGHWLAQ